ncbi:low density lipoprotein receptor adapter protein 1-A-like isoform X2 [Aphidius gifuensis]|uniref:low density lipoprotein receptor adapter protein 1-A-like isoform X2 n=1 Tax=Aphidius gifuensis TaxID=684658 RepID=UPI001CDC7EEA|nr:low density lipoprotein receptor adapter protein 1-A-like isoform X2 [Aphidius gifuensis]
MLFFKKLNIFARNKKLCEEWALASSRECIEIGESIGLNSNSLGPFPDDEEHESKFNLKYLGSTLVEVPSSEEATADAIKTIITLAKASGKKLRRVILGVSHHGIRMTDISTKVEQFHISIYKISYCSADATYDHVFAFIGTNANETLECHAYLCPKRKMAQVVTLTVARTFNSAYESWQKTQANMKIRELEAAGPSGSSKISTTDHFNDIDEIMDEDENAIAGPSGIANEKNLLIDLESEMESTVEKSWVSFEDDCIEEKYITKSSDTNNIAMTTIKGNANYHVVPRPTTGLKIQNAWGETRSSDLRCS